MTPQLLTHHPHSLAAGGDNGMLLIFLAQGHARLGLGLQQIGGPPEG